MILVISAVFTLSFALFYFFGLSVPQDVALLNDARGYWEQAMAIVQGTLAPTLVIDGRASMPDVGHINLLAFSIRAFGPSVRNAQILNGVLWALTCVLVALIANDTSDRKAAYRAGILAAISPVFTSFSGMLYGEPFAAFALISTMYCLIRLQRASSKKYRYVPWLIFSVIFATMLLATKSVYYLLPAFALLIAFIRQQKKLMAAFALMLLFGLPFQFLAQSGGRGQFNFQIQVSKLKQPWKTIAACSFYNLSYSFGKHFLPQYMGACRQNEYDISLPRTDENPYFIVRQPSERPFTYKEGFSQIAQQPLKYAAVAASSFLNLVFIEGYYPTVQASWPGWVKTLAFLIAKVLFSLALWFLTLRLLKNALLGRNPGVLPLMAPVFYFFLVVGNFPIEQRYFFPLLPLLHLFAGIQLRDRNQKP